MSISSLVGQRHSPYEMFIFGKNRPSKVCCVFFFLFQMDFEEYQILELNDVTHSGMTQCLYLSVDIDRFEQVGLSKM
jgi:hypothetical protein